MASKKDKKEKMDAAAPPEPVKAPQVAGSQLSDLMRDTVLPWICSLFDGKFVKN